MALLVFREYDSAHVQKGKEGGAYTRAHTQREGWRETYLNAETEERKIIYEQVGIDVRARRLRPKNLEFRQ